MHAQIKILVLSILVLMLSCNQQTNNKGNDKVFADSLAMDTVLHDDPAIDKQIWAFSEMGDTIIKIRSVTTESLNPKQLINLLNSKYSPSVTLEFDKLSNDTVYVKIPNSTILTQQMGSHGAYDYMITCTFTLTELNGIEFVNFNFESGDHAGPGVYSRQYFLDQLKQIQIMNFVMVRQFILNG